MKIGIVVHGPNIIDSGYALKIINILKEYGEVTVRLGGTMGRTAVIDAGLEDIIDISQKLFPSESLKLFNENKSDIIVLMNYGKSEVTGQVFGYKVYNHYLEKIKDNSIPVIQIERPGETDGSIINWNHRNSLSDKLAFELNLKKLSPEEIYDKHIRFKDNINQRVIHGVSPNENIIVNGIVIGKTDSDELTLISKNDHIHDIIGGELKAHGVVKLGEIDLQKAIVKTGLLRKSNVNPRILENSKNKKFTVAFLNHAGVDVYKFKDVSLVITVGDDTTLIASDILYRFAVPIIGITDGDLDKVVENGFKTEKSIIFEVESGYDDIVGRIIGEELFKGKEISHEFSDIEEVKLKIIDIVNNIKCKNNIIYID